MVLWWQIHQRTPGGYALNNTKWKELLTAFYQLECSGSSPAVRWRTRDLETGFLSPWDGTWRHFACDPGAWKFIDFLQIELTQENKVLVLEALRRIHIPAAVSEGIVTIYGYRQDVDYFT